MILFIVQFAFYCVSYSSRLLKKKEKYLIIVLTQVLVDRTFITFIINKTL